MPKVAVNPDVLKWAREERGLARHDAADLLGIPEDELVEYETGTRLPMLGLLRAMSEKYQINLVSLFLPQRPGPLPPNKQLRDFRLSSARRKPLGHETLIAIQEVRDALEAFAELREADPSLVPLPALDRLAVRESAEHLAARQRALIKISAKDQFKWPRDTVARDKWRAALESLGIFVYLLPMATDECRGFSMTHEGIAAICINDREESAGAECFTLLHEYCHLLRRETGLSDENRGNTVERYCNRFAGAFLIPKGELRGLLNSPYSAIDYSDDVVARLARKFKVSQRAMAVRLEETGLAPPGFYRRHTTKWDKPKPKPKPDGGGGMTKAELTTRQFGDRHTKTVVEAFRRRVINLSDAHRMLGASVDLFGSQGAPVE